MARVNVLPGVPSIPLLATRELRRKVKVLVCLSLPSRHGGAHRSEGLKACLAAWPGRERHLAHPVLPLSPSQGDPTLSPLPKQPSQLCLQDPHLHCFYLPISYLDYCLYIHFPHSSRTAPIWPRVASVLARSDHTSPPTSPDPTQRRLPNCPNTLCPLPIPSHPAPPQDPCPFFFFSKCFI